MNVIVFITDQQRAIQHFPPWLGEANMPGLTPAAEARHRASTRVHQRLHVLAGALDLMSGYFPAQHGVKYTLETDMPAAAVPAGRARDQLQEPGDRDRGRRLQRRLQGQVPLRQAGQRNRPAVPDDVNQYGFTRWNPPDAGANQDVPRRAAGSTTTTAAS